jgi:hypothetical protein
MDRNAGHKLELKRAGSQFVSLAGNVWMYPDIGCELRQYFATNARVGQLGKIVGVNACPIGQMPLVDQEIVIATSINKRRDAWRAWIKLIGSLFRDADPKHDLVALHRNLSAKNFDAGGLSEIGQIPNDPRHAPAFLALNVPGSDLELLVRVEGAWLDEADDEFMAGEALAKS